MAHCWMRDAAQVAIPALAGNLDNRVVHARLRLPARVFGAGLRDLPRLVRHAAFVGTAERVVPKLASFSPLCAEIVGADFFDNRGRMFHRLIHDAPAEGVLLGTHLAAS